MHTVRSCQLLVILVLMTLRAFTGFSAQFIRFAEWPHTSMQQARIREDLPASSLNNMALAGSLASSVERKFRSCRRLGWCIAVDWRAIYETMGLAMSQLKQLHDSGAGYAH